MRTMNMSKVLKVLMMLGISWQVSAVMMQKEIYQEEMLTSLGDTIVLPKASYVVKDEGYSSTRSLAKEKIIQKLIQRNNPNILQTTVRDLAEDFVQAEKKFGVPAYILQAIAFVESSYIVNAVNKSSDDYGIMQINEYNIKAYGFVKFRLLTEMDYSINAGAEVFKWFYDRYPLEEALMRYNCGTLKSCVEWKSVRNYLKKIKGAM